MIALAACYYNGMGVEQDFDKAFMLYRYASKNDKNGLAFCGTGVCCELGNGITQDSQKALEYHNLSAEMGSYQGELYRAVCYYRGVGIEQNYAKAFELFEKLQRKMRAVGRFAAWGFVINLATAPKNLFKMPLNIINCPQEEEMLMHVSSLLRAITKALGLIKILKKRSNYTAMLLRLMRMVRHFV